MGPLPLLFCFESSGAASARLGRAAARGPKRPRCPLPPSLGHRFQGRHRSARWKRPRVSRDESLRPRLPTPSLPLTRSAAKAASAPPFRAPAARALSPRGTSPASAPPSPPLRPPGQQGHRPVAPASRPRLRGSRLLRPRLGAAHRDVRDALLALVARHASCGEGRARRRLLRRQQSGGIYFGRGGGRAAPAGGRLTLGAGGCGGDSGTRLTPRAWARGVSSV